MQFPPDFKLFLASQSPRRHSLLSELGVPFTVVPSDASESLRGKPVEVLAEENALAKVRGAHLPQGQGAGAFVLGTDTLVSAGREVMGKPASAQEAALMLATLSGRRHQVVSGVALAHMSDKPGVETEPRVIVRSARTEVTFADVDESQVAAYVDSGEWRGKAGGYAVQGLAALLVSGIKGEYTGVVGLPLHLLGGMFRELGFDLLRRSWVTDDDRITMRKSQ